MKARELRGMIQLELEKRSGVWQPYISRIELAKTRDIRLETAWRLCFVLGISLDALVGMPDLRG
jgi:transcriptional regulator with XRE-family HTH domain